MATERPILFSGEMVRAILAGRKTQTRRIVKPQPVAPLRFSIDRPAVGGSVAYFAYVDAGGVHHNELSAECRYGQPGDRLWVREAAYIAPPNFGDDRDCNLTDYEGRPRVASWAATMDSDSVRCATDYGVKCTPSIHVPRWASRITLEVVAVRVERVQDISRDDVQAEGVESKAWDSGLRKDAFSALWDSINGKRAPWASNPWVWVVEFKRVPHGD